MKTEDLTERPSRRRPLHPCPDCGAKITAGKQRCMPCSDIDREEKVKARNKAKRAAKAAAT